MVFSYGYCWWQNWQWHQNVPLLRLILKALQLCRCNTKHIAQCIMYQCYTQSHWTSPPGDYLLGITPAAARATANITTMNECTHFSGNFDGHSGALVQCRVHRPIEEVQGFTKSHWTPPLASIVANRSHQTYQRRYFCLFSSSKRRKRSLVDVKTPVFNRDMTYQTEEKDSTNMTELFIGVVKIVCYCFNDCSLLGIIKVE